MGKRFSQYGTGVQLALLAILGTGGYAFFSSAACLAACGIWGRGFGEHVPALLFIQTFSSIGAFLLPALWVGGDSIPLRQGFSWKMLGIFLLAYALLCPVIEGWQLWTESWHLDESPWALVRRMDAYGKASEELARKLLHVENGWLFIASAFVVGPVAGICEEFFFRGGLQRLFLKRLDKHAAVWLTAAVFSLVHLDLAGFLPRVLLGALLGYAYVFGGSIWLPVLLHTLNNLLTALIEYFG